MYTAWGLAVWVTNDIQDSRATCKVGIGGLLCPSVSLWQQHGRAPLSPEARRYVSGGFVHSTLNVSYVTLIALFARIGPIFVRDVSHIRPCLSHLFFVTVPLSCPSRVSFLSLMCSLFTFVCL